MAAIKKIKHYWQIITSLPASVRFNFRYLPYSQACKLPILIYKGHNEGLRGGVKIDSSNISFGMIRLGFRTSLLFPNSGITWKNEGLVVFKGECKIGNDSYIICGKRGTITFGEKFFATGNFRIVSESSIEIGKNVLVGWGSIFIDTNFHPLFDTAKNIFKKAHGPIRVGDNNWFAAQCMLLHSSSTSTNCVFGARSMIFGNKQYEEECLYAGSPAQLIQRNVKLDTIKRNIDYQ